MGAVCQRAGACIRYSADTRRYALVALIGLLLAACRDQPTGSTPPPPTEPPLRPVAAALQCTADVASGTVACHSVDAGPSLSLGAGASGTPRAAVGVGAAGSIILGGQHTYVFLNSFNVVYTPVDSIFRFDVTVANLIGQPLNTNDGTTAAPEGVRVFLDSGPVVTGGTGTVAVDNEDGSDAFTGAGQPYFQYDSLLAPNDTSTAKQWRFKVPPSVSTFGFVVYVWARVQHPNGWVQVAPDSVALDLGNPGQTRDTLVATVYDRVGHITAEAVTWTSDYPGTASVGSTGIVQGVTVGGATVTASAGSRTPVDIPVTVAHAGLTLQMVATGLQDPLYVTAPPGDPRVFVVERPGRVRLIKNGVLQDSAFLDITGRVNDASSEQGLLSIAFHPNYATNGYFYVNYTDAGGDTRVERFSVSANPDRADSSTAHLILTIDQPFANHNGGHMLFAPDGMLLIAMGDGGSGGDPNGNGQNRATLLGDLLRIDVNAADPYGIPADNPYAGHATFRPEIWAYGLRNPWRIAIDPVAGMLYIADVGQNVLEEVNVVPLDSAGVNYGWNIMEGAACYNAPTCSTTGLHLPVLDYPHTGGACSVTGGLVYRGSQIPGIVGHYFYGDFCAGWVRSFRHRDGQAVDRVNWTFGGVGTISSFGQDAQGELYMTSFTNGRVYKLVRS